MRMSKVRLIVAAMLFALLCGCIGRQPALQGTWSDFHDEKEKVTKEPPNAE